VFFKLITYNYNIAPLALFLGSPRKILLDFLLYRLLVSFVPDILHTGETKNRYFRQYLPPDKLSRFKLSVDNFKKLTKNLFFVPP